MATLEETIAELEELANQNELSDEYAGSEVEYQYALGKNEAYSYAAYLLSQLKGK